MTSSFLKSMESQRRRDRRSRSRVSCRRALLCQVGPLQGRDWTETGHRLVFRSTTPAAVRSVLARRIAESDAESIAPAGCTRQGLVLADGLGRSVLATGSRPRGLPTVARVSDRRGRIDYLTAATSWRERPRVPRDLLRQLVEVCRIACAGRRAHHYRD